MNLATVLITVLAVYAGFRVRGNDLVIGRVKRASTAAFVASMIVAFVMFAFAGVFAADNHVVTATYFQIATWLALLAAWFSAIVRIIVHFIQPHYMRFS